MLFMGRPKQDASFFRPILLIILEKGHKQMEIGRLKKSAAWL